MCSLWHTWKHQVSQNLIITSTIPNFRKSPCAPRSHPWEQAAVLRLRTVFQRCPLATLTSAHHFTEITAEASSWIRRAEEPPPHIATAALIPNATAAASPPRKKVVLAWRTNIGGGTSLLKSVPALGTTLVKSSCVLRCCSRFWESVPKWKKTKAGKGDLFSQGDAKGQISPWKSPGRCVIVPLR